MQPASANPVIVVCTATYLPGYQDGGPIRSMSNLVEALGDEFDFRIVTSDRDGQSGARLRGVPVDRWCSVGKAQVYYASSSTVRSVVGIPRLVAAQHGDVLYLNSFFEPVFTLQPLLAWWLGAVRARKLVVAPRGELAREALAQRWWKKRPFMLLARAIGLHRDVVWQAASPSEVADIERMLGGGRPPLRVLVAPNLVAPLSGALEEIPPRTPRASGAPLRVCTVSRIAPIKNLDFSLRVLALVQVPVRFDIYGPQQRGDYWSRCEELIAALPPHIEVNYRGPIEHEQVATTLADHDLFLLPTQSESFGHAIVEALAAGLPVLISDQTPWRGLVAEGCGWDLPLNEPAAFARVIEQVAHWDPLVMAGATERARDFAAGVREDRRSIEQSRALFR